MLKELLHFVIHLRLHYQFLILSGGYWMSGLFITKLDWLVFLQQFLVVHVLLFGGATAFNSFWDKDEGPIGGLKNPPKMTQWMRWVSLGFMFSGFVLITQQPLIYWVLYAISLFLFWAYSTPILRWKGHPILSVFVIAVSTGSNGFLLGRIAGDARFEALGFLDWVAAVGVALMLTSFYPISQVFQMEEDQRRGDQTFAMRYGVRGVTRFFLSSFVLGTLLTGLALYPKQPLVAYLIVFPAMGSLFYVRNILSRLEEPDEQSYRSVMNIKYVTSVSFVSFLIGANVIIHLVNT